jgi:hypothetical protein
MPHDRETAIRSVLDDSPHLQDYALQPLSVQLYDSGTGVVHYIYSATVEADEKAPMRIAGRWTEVYVKQNGRWVMVAVSGRPDKGKAD